MHALKLAIFYYASVDLFEGRAISFIVLVFFQKKDHNITSCNLNFCQRIIPSTSRNSSYF